MNFYTVDELQSIVARGARVMKCPMSEDGANEIARRSRGTPRIAGRLLRRVRDFALVDGDAIVTRQVADRALKLLDVDSIGLDQMDRRYLDMVAHKFRRRPGRESKPSPPRSPSRATPSRTLSSLFCCSRVF